MPTRTLIADLLSAVVRAEERLKARVIDGAVESVERFAGSLEPQTETPADHEAFARTRANIDRYWRNHFGQNQGGDTQYDSGHDKNQFDKSQCCKD
jgi:hypothetical protein